MTGNTMHSKLVEILLVEDSLGDIRLTQEALKDAKVKNNLSICRDGVDAMNFLHKRDGYENTPHIDLILLDLNMPRKNGLEVLKEIKSDNQLKLIPVVILTTSEAETDIVKSYDLNANCYIKKPVDFEQFLEIINSIEQFWLTVVKLP